MFHKTMQQVNGTFNSISEQDYILALEHELERLRESTKEALHQSWDEVELLQQELADHMELLVDVEADLDKAKESEEYWRQRCLEAERRASFSSSSSSSDIHRTPLNLLKRLSSKISNQTTITTLVENEEGSFFSSGGNDVSEALREKEDRIEELEVILASRDEVIERLQLEATQQMQSTKAMESEMKCAKETLRIQQQRSSNTIQRLKIQLNQKEEVVKDLDGKVIMFRNYVDDLADELENTLDMIQKIQIPNFHCKISMGRSLDSSPCLECPENKDIFQ